MTAKIGLMTVSAAARRTMTLAERPQSNASGLSQPASSLRAKLPQAPISCPFASSYLHTSPSIPSTSRITIAIMKNAAILAAAAGPLGTASAGVHKMKLQKQSLSEQLVSDTAG